ncbi:TetR/AcrR family transcriptional regulator [Rhodococcoides corynebacterioides]|uniref:TetR family transcriptional regulator n=1 Tax=Rhodococcoides corynebacterioides TaxID=53972 RepID=A0ABS7P2M2_9NOCA|nr:TetR/AcrR family transcriptional regulator [Rhodococcus corynebacterioides]MBY6366660.1 TetR family transcriptional regulator [Rhodococcus corynebacterioides]MBY6409718.1 TetR family transcriptional regulator [Rhodococcus corynebacterioides]
MPTRLSADERRRQLADAGLALAVDHGIAAVTVRGIAERADVSLGIVHYCFANKDAVVGAMADVLITELGEAVSAALDAVPRAGEGPSAVRDTVRRGLSALWDAIERTPERQILTYEITAYAVRAAGPHRSIAERQYRAMDDATAPFLTDVAAATATTWSVPVPVMSRSILATLDGVVLRWLVDRDSHSAAIELDALADRVAAWAVAR